MFCFFSMLFFSINGFVLPHIPQGRYAFVRNNVCVTVDVNDLTAIVKWDDRNATAIFNPENGYVVLGEPLNSYARNAGVWIDEVRYKDDLLKIIVNGRLGFEVDLVLTNRSQSTSVSRPT